jgi:hypothetical protein
MKLSICTENRTAFVEQETAPKDAADTVTTRKEGNCSEAPKPSTIKPGTLESILKKAPVLPAGVALTI